MAPPSLTVIQSPGTIEQGSAATIMVQASDNSGIASVTLSITTPSGAVSTMAMPSVETNRYRVTLTNATALGTYNFNVTAKDSSFYHNTTTVSGSFRVVQDRTAPTISAVGVTPAVQLAGGKVAFSCDTSDPSGIRSVGIVVTAPDQSSSDLTLSKEGTRYTATSSYEGIGRYDFYATSTDTLGNANRSTVKSFWITADLNDTDSDGMPDAWEEQYQLDPKDPSDASLDADDDGVSNLNEYKRGTDPLSPSSSAAAIEALQKNIAYLAVSAALLGCIVVLCLLVIRRKRHD
jgi:hypothetical protein